MHSNAARRPHDAGWNGDAAIPSPGARTNVYALAFDAAWRYAEHITGLKEPPMTSHGHFHWNELRTRDAERAKRFYGETIGWTFQPITAGDGSTYWVAYMGDQPVAGLFSIDQPRFEGVPESWIPFLAVDDVDARVKKAVAAGAELMIPIFDVPDVGRIAMLREPSGAGIGWMTPTC
jgi:predicted enzyme related to lactoylglutathione lyase